MIRFKLYNSMGCFLGEIPLDEVKGIEFEEGDRLMVVEDSIDKEPKDEPEP